MEAAGMQPAINTVNALLNMYAEGLQPDMAQEVFDKLQDTGMKVGNLLLIYISPEV